MANDILRKYPEQFDRLVSTLCEQLKWYDEVDSKGAIIWILGEYAEKIDSVEDMLEYFVEEENIKV